MTWGHHLNCHIQGSSLNLTTELRRYRTPEHVQSTIIAVRMPSRILDLEEESSPSLVMTNDIPPSEWIPLQHRCVESVSREVDQYFCKHWNFASEKARKTFLAADFSGVTCLYFPLAKDDRIHLACRLLTILFLIDDELEEMSFEDGEAYNARLMPIARGHVLPDRNDPAEWIFYDIWQGMRASDAVLADDVLEPTFMFMRAQTDRIRLHVSELGSYLEYREKDVGTALLSALMRFVMGLYLRPSEAAHMKQLEQNCARHLSIVNDIYSWEKELQASKKGHAEGSSLCSGVLVLSQCTGLEIKAAKRVLWAMTREWELTHDRMVAHHHANGCSDVVALYMKGIEYQMSGNEFWSKTTRRYKV